MGRCRYFASVSVFGFLVLISGNMAYTDIYGGSMERGSNNSEVVDNDNFQ